MKNFINRIFRLFLLPALIILITVVIWDPFRVFFSYDDYYTNNSITGNREDVCKKLLVGREEKPTSFIVGNSRSLAYKTQYWSTKISDKPESCFHYDGSEMGIYRTAKALKFLDKKTTSINNLLLIIDTEFLKETSNPEGHLFIQHPNASGESTLKYYWTFLKASLDADFIRYNLIYKLTGKYYDYMGNHLSKSKYSHVSNNLTADLWYSYDRDIKSDSAKYYQKLIKNDAFYKRSSQVEISEKLIDKKQLELLAEIKEITRKNNTKVKIVISPLYSQLAFNKSDLDVLSKMFGDDAIHDFSGKNIFTSDFTDYYESSHYKPYLANEILELVYPNSSNSTP